ncbi:MAG: hypothetical protein JWP27_2868 [Flaviaesturariibacter sp.]|nr:hypothetical protein [Flaviaesturariibacter sp.]
MNTICSSTRTTDSNRHAVLAFVLLFLSLTSKAQETSTETAGRLTPKELTIPPSPVFDLMGVTPSQINRTSDIKDFKVDWSFKSWKLSPNLALQSQPVWEMLYNRKDLRKYQEASPFMRRLASLDLSIGSVQNEESDRRIGFATKINIYQQKDPLMAKDLYGGIGEKYTAEKAELEAALKEAKLKLDTIRTILDKPALRATIKSIEESLLSINARRRDEINGIAKVFVAENWNASSLDVAFGRIYTYKTDSAGTLKGLRLNRNTGWGAWMNGSVGLGKRALLTGLFRTTWYEEELTFSVEEEATGNKTEQSAVAQNTLFSMGANLRYGNPVYTFFIEFLYEKKGLKTPTEALQQAFEPGAGSKVVASTVNWDIVHPNQLSLGGDWRISRSVIINYGMRCVFSDRWKFQTFTPVVSISCMMR